MKKIVILVSIIISINVSAQEKNFKPPLINGISAVDYYHGIKIEDPYRNIESIDDALVQNWIKNYSLYTNSVLNSIAERDSLVNKFESFANRKSFRIKDLKVTEKGDLFFLKKNSDDTIYKLYHKKTYGGNELLLFNPANYKPDSGNKYTINYINPSWNNKYIVVSMSYSGKEISDMIIIDVDKGEILPEIIPNCYPSVFFGANWLPDNSGFTYQHITVADPSKDNFLNNNKSVIYRIGQDPSELNVILSADTHPQLGMTSSDHPPTRIFSKNSKYIIGYISGANSFWDCYYTEIENVYGNNIPRWKKLYSKEDQVYRGYGMLKDDEFIFISGKNASNYKIASVNIQNPNFANPKIIVEEKDNEIIEEFILTSDGLYYTTIENGVKANLYFFNGQKEKKIVLPREAGEIYLSNINESSEDLWVSLKGWLNEIERYKYDLKSDTFTKDTIYPKSDYPEFDDFVVEEVLVPSHDGVEIPLSLVYKKDLKKNGKNPTFIYGYGAYGKSINPSFSSIRGNWIMEGGILCIAHARGGGEKGEDWHKAGQKLNKPNTWKDVISCTEYLIENKYTSNKYTAIYGASAGGIMVGRAITERPDLYAVAISSVGQMNPLRNEARKGGGGTNYQEYGTVKDSLECMGLIEMDPYLHIKKNTEYPAMLLTAGMNDPRIPVWIPAKFAARMQATGTKKPILFDVDYNAGHKGNSSTEEKWANFFAFALWQMGHPDYQLKE